MPAKKATKTKGFKGMIASQFEILVSIHYAFFIKGKNLNDLPTYN